MDATETWEQLSRGVAAFRQRYDLVEVNGPDARKWLDGQLSQDVAGMQVGDTRDSMLLSPEGKLVALLRVHREGDDRFTLLTDEGTGEPVVERLRRFKIRVKADLQLRVADFVGLRGPTAAEVLVGLPSRAGAVGHPWPGLDGVDIEVTPTASLPDGVGEGDPGALEYARIAAGVPWMGTDIQAGAFPHETGAVSRTVDFGKGCYTGQELVARVDSRGGSAPRYLGVVVLDDELASGESIPLGAVVTMEGEPVATVTSRATAPGSAPPIGLALVKRRAVAGPGYLVEGVNARVEEPPVTGLLPGAAQL
ncbi:MAG TPA: hypothetical protein VGS21_12645 [Acidimicrobiales bacterium]|nr:hypothetical protein [Acidimicrobiales bacterium]